MTSRGLTFVASRGRTSAASRGRAVVASLGRAVVASRGCAVVASRGITTVTYRDRSIRTGCACVANYRFLITAVRNNVFRGSGSVATKHDFAAWEFYLFAQINNIFCDNFYDQPSGPFLPIQQTAVSRTPQQAMQPTATN